MSLEVLYFDDLFFSMKRPLETKKFGAWYDTQIMDIVRINEHTPHFTIYG